MELITAFIFKSDDDDSVTLMNHEYNDKCSTNASVMMRVDEFKRKYDKIKMLLHSEKRFIRRWGFRSVYPEICEAKRNIARSVTDYIQPIADFCVGDEKLRKEFVLNTLLLLETALDYICSMEENLFDDIYERHSERCFSVNMQALIACHKKSFDLYFWEKVPEKQPTVAKLVNGAICK